MDDWLGWPAIAVGVVVAVLLVHEAVWRVGMRLLRGRRLAEDLRKRCYRSARLLVVVVALMLLVQTAPAELEVPGWVVRGLLVALILVAAWLVARLLLVAADVYVRRSEVGEREDPWSRRRRTQIDILQRVAVATIMVIGSAVALLTFEQARTLGASLLASAGLAGVIAGVAARSTIANLAAGLQIAFSEQIKLDDVVIVEGEWGQIEEITLSHVVVRIWDLRRLVLPTTYFTDQPFENWTRTTSELMGTVFLYADYTVPIDPLRRELARILETSPLWDGQAQSLLVTSLSDRAVELRAVVSAHNASNLWNLRCEVREGLLSFLQREYPDALPHVRAELSQVSGNGQVGAPVGSEPDRKST